MTTPDNAGEPAAGMPSTMKFTPLQGQYLAFIHAYTAMYRQPPAERDIQRHFQVTPPTVHNMILKLEKNGLITRTPGQARTLKVCVLPEDLPPLA